MPKRQPMPSDELGAMILTVINMGQDHLLIPFYTEKDIRLMWDKFLAIVVKNHLDEDSMKEERTYWERQLRRREKYATDTIQEYATWLFAKQ